MDCNLPGSSVHGISQARILEWVAISVLKRSSWPRDWTHVSCIGRRILYHWTTRWVQGWYYSSLSVWQNSPVKPSGPGVFFLGRDSRALINTSFFLCGQRGRKSLAQLLYLLIFQCVYFCWNVVDSQCLLTSFDFLAQPLEIWLLPSPPPSFLPSFSAFIECHL